jgi:nitroimidazol reductase NimA-like FMN-containing flavoprotein (pyridoxamine 5'-phosphate oxidase superfamily)
MSTPARTDFTRKADRGSHERAAADAVLAEALVGHLGFIDASGLPVVLPVAVAPDGDRVLFHGSTGSRLFRTLAAGAPCCLTVTLLDALVLARSAFESSMNYRSLVVMGSATELTGADKERALRVLTDHLTPERWDALRPMTRREVAATCVLALPLAEFSVKARDGGTDEPADDLDWPIWAGQVPVVAGVGTPVPEPGVAPALAGPVLPRALGGAAP